MSDESEKSMLNQFRRTFMFWNTFGPLRRVVFEAANQVRLRMQKIDYVLFTLDDGVPALPERRNLIQRQIMGEPPMSLPDIERAFRMIGDDPRPQGVILNLRSLPATLADLQSLRGSIRRLREKGKRIVVFALDYDLRTYYVAAAANEILVQPGGFIAPLGLRLQTVFLKDALDEIGLSFDIVAISPFKSGGDSLTRSDISPEGREQLEWLVESNYNVIVHDIAQDRGMSEDDVRQLIDEAPYSDKVALKAGYVDGIINEEELSAHLKAEHILTWEKATNLLIRKWRPQPEKHITLLPITGTIMDGKSDRPPIDIPVPLFGGPRSGDLTVTRQVRRIMQDKRCAAVIVYIDSPGGSASASEAMAAALDELAKTRPVVVYMNGVAASGGYYVATPARWIVAQPGTLTGSIGVFGGKAISQGTYDKLHINRVEIARGANISYSGDKEPYTDAQRESLREYITHAYHQFVNRVATARNMDFEAVDAISAGRVWTGQQALENGLVDELGDLTAALKKARTLADLPEHAPLLLYRDRKQDPLPPQIANPAATIPYIKRGVRAAFNGQAMFLLPFVLDD